MIEALALAAAVAACSWDRPGHNPFTGPVPAAVDRYTDIPAPVRARLRARMERRDFDEIAVITRDRIVGRHQYADLRDMHFGAGQVCGTVIRAGWADTAAERGLIYCEEGHCIIVPTVCRNVSRVTRVERTTPQTALLLSDEPVTFDVDLIPPRFVMASVPAGSDGGDMPSGGGWSGGDGPLVPGGSDGSAWASMPPVDRAPIFALVQSGFVPVAPVPEPGKVAMLLLGLALVGIAAMRAHRQRPQIPRA